jgi:hypothetical protein
VSVPECDGDGLLMTMECAAGTCQPGMPSTLEQIELIAMLPSYLLVRRRASSSILVNRSARRFVNEAVNYNAFGPVLHNFDPNSHDYPNLPYWIVFDGRFKSKYPVFTSRPKDPAPSWAVSADTIEALAEHIGLDGKILGHGRAVQRG